MVATIKTQGFLELADEIQKLADQFVDSGLGKLDAIVKMAAEPIKEQAISNAPRGATGDLKGAIGIGKKIYKRGDKWGVTVGVHRKDWHHEDYYPAYVEFGHGGPHPAPPHPYLLPAFDAKQEEAYGIIKEQLRAALEQKT